MTTRPISKHEAELYTCLQAHYQDRAAKAKSYRERRFIQDNIKVIARILQTKTIITLETANEEQPAYERCYPYQLPKNTILTDSNKTKLLGLGSL